MDVIEFTDPACSWAWGTEPKLRLLRWRYEDRFNWRRVMGGLIEDMSKRIEGFDAVRYAPRQSKYWRGVFEHTGMSYPANLQWMISSTIPAGRAVKAAELQGQGARVLRRMRESIFVFGRPADTHERILENVKGIVDEERFASDLESDLVDKAFHEDFEETRRPNDYVRNLEGDWPGIGNMKHSDGRDRFAFPTLIFRGPDGEATVPGWCDYDEYERAMETAEKGSTRTKRNDPAPNQYFTTWPTATQKEVETICRDVPDDVVTYDWGEGTFYLTTPEAEARASFL